MELVGKGILFSVIKKVYLALLSDVQTDLFFGKHF